MPRVVLSTLEYDPLCPVEIDALPSTSAGDMRRRVSRVATLDGGAAFNDGGYAEADRTITLRWVPRSAAAEERIARLLRTYTRITVAMADGCFLAAPERYTRDDEQASMTLLVERRLDA